MNDLSNLPELLSRKDVLRLCKIGKDTYYDLLQHHDGLAVRLPGRKRLRVRKSVLISLHLV